MRPKPATPPGGARSDSSDESSGASEDEGTTHQIGNMFPFDFERVNIENGYTKEVNRSSRRAKWEIENNPISFSDRLEEKIQRQQGQKIDLNMKMV